MRHTLRAGDRSLCIIGSMAERLFRSQPGAVRFRDDAPAREVVAPRFIGIL